MRGREQSRQRIDSDEAGDPCEIDELEERGGVITPANRRGRGEGGSDGVGDSTRGRRGRERLVALVRSTSQRRGRE
eukprot:2279221-Rhodomonas_salina.1